uniref:Uncharacterized protein n=1 Tax=Timema poppense TaxID=170557 RepID=A0A7R9DSU9_TIMPO|nr:unnamed protein product [Timema poppensis]
MVRLFTNRVKVLNGGLAIQEEIPRMYCAPRGNLRACAVRSRSESGLHPTTNRAVLQARDVLSHGLLSLQAVINRCCQGRPSNRKCLGAKFYNMADTVERLEDDFRFNLFLIKTMIPYLQGVSGKGVSRVGGWLVGSRGVREVFESW